MYEALKQHFAATFHQNPTHLFSAPGRTELGGNHTDHQHGCVLAAAVNLETVAAVAENGSQEIRLESDGYGKITVDLNDLSVHPEEQNTTAALIRGVAAGFAQKGYALHGFDACVTSTVLPGSGLSSSAAFEVLLGTIFNHLFCTCRCTAVEIAQIGQFAETTFFGKPCGLMDQTACAVGNVIGIDFQNPQKPQISQINLDLAAFGYGLCIIDSFADHAGLTQEYAAVPQEMKAVANFLGKEVLRDADESEFYAHLARIRKQLGDRAALRAMHFFDENRRVGAQVDALKQGNFDRFLELVNESGLSSQTLLQNITPAGYTFHQDLAVALAVAKKLLGGKGAVRVHGGGFAGTIQAFVPLAQMEAFVAEMEKVLGAGCCHVLSIRSNGGILLETC